MTIIPIAKNPLLTVMLFYYKIKVFKIIKFKKIINIKNENILIF